jgi:hypothetical protein
LSKKHGAEFAGANHPDPHGPTFAFPREQHGVKIH